MTAVALEMMSFFFFSVDVQDALLMFLIKATASFLITKNLWLCKWTSEIHTDYGIVQTGSIKGRLIACFPFVLGKLYLLSAFQLICHPRSYSVHFEGLAGKALTPSVFKFISLWKEWGRGLPFNFNSIYLWTLKCVWLSCHLPGHLLEGFCPQTELKGSVTFALAMMWFSVAVESLSGVRLLQPHGL